MVVNTITASNYLPLTGGTLTGLLSGTSISLSNAATSTNYFSVGASGVTNLDWSGGDLFVKDDMEVDGDNMYCAASGNFTFNFPHSNTITYNDASSYFGFSANILDTGYVSSTAGLYTQNNLRIGGTTELTGAATTTGEFTVTNGTHGLHIIPGNTTTTLEFF
jgi:hypothetical protein